MDARASKAALDTAIHAARQAEEWAEALEALVLHRGEAELRAGAVQCRQYCTRALACLLQVDRGHLHDLPPFLELLHDPLPILAVDEAQQLRAALEAIVPLAEVVDARLEAGVPGLGAPHEAYLAPNLRLMIAFLRLEGMRREHER